MLATEKAYGSFPRPDMQPTLDARAYVHGSTRGSDHMASRSHGYPSQGSKPYVNGGQLFPASSGPQSSQISNLSPSGVPPTTSEGPLEDTNIMNRKGDKNSSLYQICMSLKRRLAEVPGFEQYIVEMEEEEHNAEDGTDPVTVMWNCLRRGFPLMTIYNALGPRAPLRIDESRVAEAKLGKAATFKFLQACLEELKFPANECFLITDLYAEDTTGFVKVTKVVNRVLDILDQRGLLIQNGSNYGDARDNEHPVKLTHAQNVVKELVSSERDYVQHLELLQQFKNQIEQSGAIAGDAIHDIFLNLNALLDFQRRFLIRIEQQNSLDESAQNWGRLFVQYQDGFRVYEPYIANQEQCTKTVAREWDKIRTASVSPNLEGMLGQAILGSFLVKPMQRLSKYPLMLDDLRKKGGLDSERVQDLVDGNKAASSVLLRANDAIDKQKAIQAVGELQSRVEDWKGHNIDHFGELKLYGSHTVLKGDGQREVEREVRDIRLIFDALPLECRKILRVATKHVRPFVASPPPQSRALQEPVLDQEPLGPRVDFREQSVRPQEQTPIRGTLASVSPDLDLLIEKSSGQDSSYKKGTMRQFVSMFQLKKANSPFIPTTSVNPLHLGSSERLNMAYNCLLLTSTFRPKAKPIAFVAGFGDRLKSGIRKLNTKLKLKKHRYRNLDASYFNYHFSFNAPFMETNCILHVDDKNTEKLEAIANEEGLVCPVVLQYKVYLFERILLCCKEINPNKPKNKLRTDKSLVDKKGKPRLQLKGRIFMQNVTDVMSFAKSGSYFIQIFWKGDPGVENFVIRFMNDEAMKKWQRQVEIQRKSFNDAARISGQTGTSETEFTYLRNHAILQNPYQQESDVEDDEEGTSGAAPIGGYSEFSMSRNTSSTSLRARSASGSGPSSQPAGRVPPPRFPMPEPQIGGIPPLTVSTTFTQPAMSPSEHAGNSYFSPTVDSPMSVRSSSQAGMFPFPRQAAFNSAYASEENKHNTAPPMGRAPLRDSQAPLNGYSINGRTVQRPSLPAMANTQQNTLSQQSRYRSASSPDFQAPNGSKRHPSGQYQSQAEGVPVPPIPAHMAQMRAPVNRSQNNSPTGSILPLRTATQSPSLIRDRVPQQFQNSYAHEQSPRSEPRSFGSPNPGSSATSSIESRIMSPSLTSGSSSDDSIPYPSQLKMKIWFDPPPSHVTIVVPIIIKHRSLIDRIDSKMEKISYASISKGTARLRYLDSDDDYITIKSDEDVSLAIEDWGVHHEDVLRGGGSADFELHWNSIESAP